MTWRQPLWKAVYDRAQADTGSGGLFESSGTNLLTGFYNTRLPTDQGFPAVVYEISSAFADDGFAKAIRDIDIRFHIFTKEEPTDGGTDGWTLLANISARIGGDWTSQSDRVPTYGFDRFEPTLTGGFTADIMALVDSIENHEPENGILHQIDTYSLLISRAGA